MAPYCPRDGTGLSDHEVAQGYETVTDPSVYVRFPLTSGPYAGHARPCWSGRRPRGRWSPTPRSRCVPTSPTSWRPTARSRWSSPSRWSAPRSARAGPSGRRVTGAEMERWTYQRPFELVEFPPVEPGATRPPPGGARRLRHDRGRHRPGAPVPRLRRGRHGRLPRLRAARRGARALRRALLRRHRAGGRSVLQARRRRPRARPGVARADVPPPRPTSTAIRTAGAATPR